VKLVVKKIWRYSWLVTLPITVVFFYWLWLTFNHYYAYSVRYNPPIFKMDFHQSGVMQFQHLVRRFRQNIDFQAIGDIPSSDFKSINLFVPESSLAELESNMPHSGFEYVTGNMWNGKKMQRIKFRYRGDTHFHWSGHKKSIRIKTKKSQLHEGLRSFNLLGAKGVVNHLGFRLASMLDMPVPHSEIVSVSLNGEYLGVYGYIEQLEELTLRRNGFMPGDIYSGELVVKDEYAGLSTHVFSHPGTWTKVASNNHYPLESMRPLEELTGILSQPHAEDSASKLSDLLDIEAFARFNVAEILMSSIHNDPHHNWRLYYDPARSKFMPIMWDPAGWPDMFMPKEGEEARPFVVSSELHTMLHRDYDFYRARYKVLHDFFTSGNDSVFLAEAEETIEKVIAATKNDPVYYPEYCKDDECSVALAAIEKKYRGILDNIKKVFSDLRGAYIDHKEDLNYSVLEKTEESISVGVFVSGLKPVTNMRLQFIGNVQSIESVSVRYISNNQIIEKDITGDARLQGLSIDLGVSLLSHHEPFVSVMTSAAGEVNSVRVNPAFYALKIKGEFAENKLLDLLVDQSSGRLERAVKNNQLTGMPFNDLANVVNAHPVSSPLVWGGVVEIKDVTVIDKVLVLLPNTTLLMHPGASLIVENKMMVLGEEGSPVRIAGVEGNMSPWGAVVLRGKGADGSVFRHCEISSGSGYKGDLFQYSAMLSIHGVNDVEINNCAFKDNKIVDDMVHVVYSDVYLKNSSFSGAFADALDVDISSIRIENTSFNGSGNDAIDFMDSRAVVINSVIKGSADKGMSVGEGSRLLAINNKIDGNNIGIQSKDGAYAVLQNVDLVNNQQAADAYKKNWRYDGGGRIVIYKSKVIDNIKGFSADKHSAIWVHDSYLDKRPELDKKDKKRIMLDETVSFNRKLEDISTIKSIWRYPGEKEVMGDVGVGYWDSAKPEYRGAKLNGS